MLRPFVAYLRVYEPLSAFGDPPDEQLVQAVESAKLTRARAGEREHLLWLRSQISIPPRLLPAERIDGSPSPSTKTDVLVLDPADVPTASGTEVGPGPLVCPLELRVRSAAALAGFLGEAHPALRTAVLDAAGVSADTVRARANAALRDLHGTTMHVLSTTWTVPLPWFSIVEPDERRLVLGSGMDDPKRELSWRVAMRDALTRIAEAEELVHDALGDTGPTRILAETNRWLANFHPASAVELDYGGLVQLIEDPILESDTSADEVHAMLDALRGGAVEDIAELFQTLRDYWGDIAAKERFN
ncbi:hypothetical protein [Prauserella muralis]|uniref:DUF8083 domain-containing protein n=1 Tax=Prauserella muralis TaxID=588067 RepID=A0A2V4B846_9PSEU|nr:hypothetical protein [Prauserella muralis]PXY31428.1 hypothetical protein BAY60_03320 [Prauserella muralis]TWE14238.1 hypothetical protein FHX69_6376 [Prauserella muralis]